MAPRSHDVDVLLIGAGTSSLGLACQLYRKLGVRDVELIEKGNDVGGTWRQNTYPGCGCDVPSHFYSYSWELNPDWSCAFSLQPEIQQYFRNIAIKYGILNRTRFGHQVTGADWDKEKLHWTVRVQDLSSGRTLIRRAKILVSGVGSLSVPKDCDIPGADSFQGHLFHSAKWDHSFDWSDKEVVVLGNGCSATQFVPVMTAQGPNEEGTPVKRLTQFVRSPHWLNERPNPKYTATDKALFRYVPGYQRMLRALFYVLMEYDFGSFDLVKGKAARKKMMQTSADYVRRMAPKQHADFLIPKFEYGCKRKIMDTDYLATLHRANMELIYTDRVAEITPTGVRTAQGTEIRADAIVQATGFQTHRFLYPMEIRGADGRTLQEVWDSKTNGAAQAYMGTCVSGFPNFFILMGPNTVTGHTSVIHTVELQTALVLRLLAPVLSTLHPSYSPLSLLTLQPVQHLLEAKPLALAPSDAAFAAHAQWTQARSANLVWTAGGCTSWAIDPTNRWQVAMYPDWQWKLWLRTVFIRWGDWVFQDAAGQAVSGWTVWWRRWAGRALRLALLGLLARRGLQVARQKGWIEIARRTGMSAVGRA